MEGDGVVLREKQQFNILGVKNPCTNTIMISNILKSFLKGKPNLFDDWKVSPAAYLKLYYIFDELLLLLDYLESLDSFSNNTTAVEEFSSGCTLKGRNSVTLIADCYYIITRVSCFT